MANERTPAVLPVRPGRGAPPRREARTGLPGVIAPGERGAEIS